MMRLPDRRSRTVVIGRTGTGKTVAALWHLSNYSLVQPWVIFDFKNDEHIDSIENIQHIDFDYIPSKKDDGIFCLHPLPSQQAEVEKYLWKLWARENVGVFCDETFMMGKNNDAFDTLLTQGRSKEVPMILCTQRPVWISRFAFSEASFIQIFDLNDARDIQNIESFTPLSWDEESPLQEHESFYYDIAKDTLIRLRPVPPMKEIRKAFAEKLRPKRVRI
jgi:hypothetical protein